MKNNFPSLVTPDAKTGMALAANLADELGKQIETLINAVERPGGMNYLLPPSVPKEVIAGILFYTIAAANQGWNEKK